MTLRRLMPDDWAAFRDIRLDMLARDPRAFGATHADWLAKPEAEIRDRLARMHFWALMRGTRAPGILQLELQVATWNAPAIAAYARAGFERVATIPRAMRDAEVFADKGAFRPAS